MEIFNIILNFEGEDFVDDIDDNGRYSKWGITIETLQNYQSGATITDLYELDRTKASKIYEEMYLKEPKLDKLPKSVQLFAVDMCVNSGYENMAITLQDALNKTLSCFTNYRVLRDGIIGSKTIKALKDVEDEYCIKIFNMIFLEERKQFFIDIVNNSPKDKKFLEGWLNRIKKLKIYV